MTAQDLSALADKLDELAMKAPAKLIAGFMSHFATHENQYHEVYSDTQHKVASFVRDEDARMYAALVNALPQITTALREAARMREAEKITLMLASFKDPRTVSCPDEELELFAKIIEDAKAIHGDLHEDAEDEEPGHGA